MDDLQQWSPTKRLQRWRRDDVQVTVTIKQSSGDLLNLTGYQPCAELTLGGRPSYPVPPTPAQFTVSNGGVDSVDAPNGTYRVVIPRAIMARCPVDVDPMSPLPSFITLYYIDPSFKRQTLGNIALNIFDGPVNPLVDEVNNIDALIFSQNVQFTVVLGLSQAPAPPFAAKSSQLTDAGAFGVQLFEAQTAADATSALASVIFNHTDVNDTDYVCTTKDSFIRVLSLTAARTITLPDPQKFIAGRQLKVGVFAANCSGAVPVVIQPVAGGNIQGQPSVSIAGPAQVLRFEHDSNQTWGF